MVIVEGGGNDGHELPVTPSTGVLGVQSAAVM